MLIFEEDLIINLLLYIILGGIVGSVAARLLGRKEGILTCVVIGIVGSFIGGFVSRLLTGGDQSFLAFNITGLFWSVIGSIILIAVLNAIRKPHHKTS